MSHQPFMGNNETPGVLTILLQFFHPYHIYLLTEYELSAIFSFVNTYCRSHHFITLMIQSNKLANYCQFVMTTLQIM